jgi:hypothetical protein
MWARITVEGDPPGEQIVEEDSQRVDVGARVRLQAANLLGRHVLKRSHHVAESREAVRAEGAGDAKIHHLHHVGVGEHDVGALEVAVDDAPLVGVADALERLEEERKRTQGGQAAGFPQHRGEGLALDVLHDHEQGAVLLDQGVERGDVGVVESGQRLGLGAEPLEHLGLRGEVGPERLDRHVATQRDVGRPVDHADAAFADLLQKLVVGDALADH